MFGPVFAASGINLNLDYYVITMSSDELGPIRMYDLLIRHSARACLCAGPRVASVRPVDVHWTVHWTVHGPFDCWPHWVHTNLTIGTGFFGIDHNNHPGTPQQHARGYFASRSPKRACLCFKTELIHSPGISAVCMQFFPSFPAGHYQYSRGKVKCGRLCMSGIRNKTF
jgi:hypothetical protein